MNDEINNQNQTLNKIGEAMLQKFVSEEIMTKSELDRKLDDVMNKYVAHIDGKFAMLQSDMDSRFEQVDKRFEQVDKRFAQIDSRYNWIIGLVITAALSIIGTVVKLH
jgi:flagellar capping protein FliD